MPQAWITFLPLGLSLCQTSIYSSKTLAFNAIPSKYIILELASNVNQKQQGEDRLCDDYFVGRNSKVVSPVMRAIPTRGVGVYWSQEEYSHWLKAEKHTLIRIFRYNILSVLFREA